MPGSLCADIGERQREQLFLLQTFKNTSFLLFAARVFPTSKPYRVPAEKICFILGCKSSKVSLVLLFLFLPYWLPTPNILLCCLFCVFPEGIVLQSHPGDAYLPHPFLFVCFRFIPLHAHFVLFEVMSIGRRKKKRQALCHLERDCLF